MTYATVPWPMEPFDSSHALGNSYGEYQDYGGEPYMHPGIDILHPPGTEIFAVKSGWVKAVLTTGAELHWRVAVGDSPGADSCDGWLYAHLEQSSIAVTVGEHVDSGQFLGVLVTWPTSNFHHLHFVKIRNSGITWAANWRFIGNPLTELVNIDDFTPPYFQDFSVGAPFRFCRNNSDVFFSVGVPVDGDVDIIAHCHDRVGHPTWELAPNEMGYEIYSDSVNLGPFTSFSFDGPLLWDQSHHTVYKNSGPCNSEGDYVDRLFYEILTNHDSDPLVTPSDVSGKWATGAYPNDSYTIKAWARDSYGNLATDSMEVTTANYHSVAGVLRTSDGNPFPQGYHISIPFSATEFDLSDSTFYMLGQPAGRYPITVTRENYLPKTVTMEVFENLDLIITLDPASYLYGDVDFSGFVNVSDAVYLIQFIFADGPHPKPWAAAVAIDSDPIVNISDVVYLINFIFAGGPPPGR